MEKAILKTLIYADIFDYPLKITEIHKWLISPTSLKLRWANKQITLRQVEKTLKILVKSKKCQAQNGYYFLPRKAGLVSKRLRRQVQSEKYLQKAKILTQILKIIPWVKLVGISGGLAVENVSKKDDIDLFIITSKNRLWISRLLILGLLSVLGQRRRRQDQGKKIAGKLCINILLEEDQLEQVNKDVFTAHEVLQMKPLWFRGNIYSKYLEDNNWVFKFLPNWLWSQYQKSNIKNKNDISKFKIVRTLYILICHFTFYTLIFNFLEEYARKFQLWYMQQPTGLERIEDGALYFHPKDYRLDVLKKYQELIQKLS